MVLMMLFGFILILLILILQFPVGLHLYCGPSAQVSRVSGFLNSQLKNTDSVGFSPVLFMDRFLPLLWYYKRIPQCLFLESKVMIILPLTLCIPAFLILVPCKAHASTPYLVYVSHQLFFLRFFCKSSYVKTSHAGSSFLSDVSRSSSHPYLILD